MGEDWFYAPRRCVGCGKMRVEDWDLLIEPDVGLCLDCLEACQAGARCWDCMCSPCVCGENAQLDGVIDGDKEH
jgi:hypothetical protein